MYRETRGWKATGESGVTEKLKWLGVIVMETSMRQWISNLVIILKKNGMVLHRFLQANYERVQQETSYLGYHLENGKLQ